MPRASALWAVLLGAFSVATGRMFGIIELYVLGVAPLVALVCAVVLVRRPAGLLMRRRVQPAQPSAGESATVDVRIEAIRNSPLCRLREMVGSDGRAAHIDVVPLRLGTFTQSTYRLPTDRRGPVTLGPATLEVVDPLGLAARRAQVADREQVVVLPRWSRVSLPHLAACEGDLVDALVRARLRSGQPDEFRGIREYAAGDDPRRVNWKATARSENPLVNDYESNPEVVTTVYLDTTGDEGDPDAFERAVSVATSFVMSIGADTNHARLRLVVGAVIDIEVDQQNRDSTSTMLALISPSDPPTSSIAPVHAGHLNAVVLVTAASDTAHIASIRRRLGRADAVTLIACSRIRTRIDWGRAVQLDDFDDFPVLWHRFVRRRRSGHT